jgi:hypothetical protein
VFVVSSYGTLYRSVDEGRTFRDLTVLLTHFEDAGGVASISVAPGDQSGSRVIATSHSTINWASRDGGASWVAVNTTVAIEDIILHPTLPDVLIALELDPTCYEANYSQCHDRAFLSTDFGRTFVQVARYVYKIEFDPVVTAFPAMAASIFKVESGYQFRGRDVTEQNLYRIDNSSVDGTAYLGGFYRHLVLADSFGFVYFPTFLFAVSKDTTSTDTVLPMLLWASTDDGRTIRRARFPAPLTITSQITILDRSDVMIMALWNNIDEAFADVYISDTDGLEYATMILDIRRRASHTFDFYRARSVAGIFFANQIEPFDTMQYRTYITTDKGAVWRLIDSPRVDVDGVAYNCTEPLNCKLHLRFEAEYAPVSHRFAVGVVVATGNVGRFASPRFTQWRPFISRDTGISWRETVPRDTYHTELGYHGSIILVVQADVSTRDIRYSLNEGESWSLVANALPSALEVDNIHHHASLTEETFLIEGHRNVNGTRTGVLAFVDFAPLNLRTCVGFNIPDANGSDYETYVPSTTAPGCLLGRVVRFVRRAQSAICVDTSNRTDAIVTTPCACVRDDYECDYGYALNIVTQQCQLNPDVRQASPFEQCAANNQQRYYVSRGYRLVPGDGCKDGLQLDRTPMSCVGVTEPPTPPPTPRPTPPPPTTTVTTVPTTTTTSGATPSSTPTTSTSTPATTTSTTTTTTWTNDVSPTISLSDDSTTTAGTVSDSTVVLPEPSPEGNDRGLGGGAIAGIVIAIVALIALLAFAVYKLRNRKQYAKHVDDSATPRSEVGMQTSNTGGAKQGDGDLEDESL